MADGATAVTVTDWLFGGEKSYPVDGNSASLLDYDAFPVREGRAAARAERPGSSHPTISRGVAEPRPSER